MSNHYVTVEKDKFKNKTTIASKSIEYKLKARRFTLEEMLTFNFRYGLITDDQPLEFLVIDVNFASAEIDMTRIKHSRGMLDSLNSVMCGEWAFLRNGQLIININGNENITLTPSGSHSDVTKQSITNASACEEYVYYEINKEILEKICKAKSVAMQISGDARGAIWELDGTRVIFLAKAIWNSIYDEKMYTDELEHEANVADQRAQIENNGCAIQIISAVIGLILSGSIKDDDIGGMLGAIFMFIIPGIIYIRNKRKKKNIQ